MRLTGSEETLSIRRDTFDVFPHGFGEETAYYVLYRVIPANPNILILL